MPDNPTKTDNGAAAFSAKIELRQLVLEHVKPARVFDAFCGEGHLFATVWYKAASYVGCDQREWTADEEIRRFVADNRRVLRNLDLAQFNVFDLDAWGSPWEQLLILAARRQWSKGERGAIVVTDGDSIRFGAHNLALSQFMRVPTSNLFKGGQAGLLDAALTKWCASSGVKQLKRWGAVGKSGQKVLYRAVVFEGT